MTHRQDKESVIKELSEYWFLKGAIEYAEMDDSMAKSGFQRMWHDSKYLSLVKFQKVFEAQANAKDCKGPFMICVEGGSSPTRQHETLESAEAEQERLSKNNHGKNVDIVQVVKRVKTSLVTEVVEV
jgi:hypothetical protein